MEFEKGMQIKAIAPWFGSKRNLAGRIVELLGPHRVYWEPFCGSMAVLLVKRPCVMETVNDLHGDLTNLARVLADEELGLELYRRTSRTLMSEGLFDEARARYVAGPAPGDEPDLWRAYDYFLLAWLGRNGLAGTASYRQGFCVRYTSKGGHAAKRWASAITSIPAWHKRLANVMILRRDGLELLEKVEDRAGTVIYADPPYLVKGAKYVHDFRDVDHERLAELLGRFRQTRVVVSYYDDPRLRELYPDWTRVEIVVSKAMGNQGSRGKKDVKALEVLLVNGQARGAGRELF